MLAKEDKDVCTQKIEILQLQKGCPDCFYNSFGQSFKSEGVWDCVIVWDGGTGYYLLSSFAAVFEISVLKFCRLQPCKHPLKEQGK
ncbi:hypothetical protein BVRB_5g126370 [Beta vulgaris subsp. vulgaris]|uniref:Uncharacterized protein n=1 Tax=Beta vulgaris subsp. vulgaris TaxID=3555 RepID=A0A0J8B8E6_BETVV|nr:hypothetical protein BVRB_5g126370 [Beta vulgaris subsp. vulgaris]